MAHATPERMRRVFAAIAAVDSGATPLFSLVAAAVDLLDLAGAAAVLMTDDGDGSVAASAGEASAAQMAAQFEVGLGPSLLAHRTGELVMTGDLAQPGDDRWPTLAPLAGETRAVLVAPMRIGAIRLGVLALHRNRPSHWSSEERLDALVLADLASSSAVDGPDGMSALDPDRLASNAVVHQATGVLAARHSISLAAALAHLRATAFAESRRLVEIAADVVTKGDGGNTS